MEDDGLAESIGESSKEYTLCVGMEFESEDNAYNFYNDHGRILGFSIRRNYITKSRKDKVVLNRKFVCSKQGQRAPNSRSIVVEKLRKETRTGCEAFMYVSFNREKSKWIVTSFKETHNHPLDLTQCTYSMRSQRKLCEAQALNIDIAVDSGLPPKASHDLISAQVGGREFVGFTQSDHKNYLPRRRQRSLEYGEAGALLRYFQTQAAQNPYFFHAIQLDVDEMVTNIFWADREMITDYGLFGDVVSFNTTFQTNKKCRPLALFTGFNHFRMTTVFGAALLYDETMESFKWLFETFLQAMAEKKPASIFTDQDVAKAKAISIVMPDVTHGLCTFHLMKNALKHLGHLFKGESNFGGEFKTCIFGYEDENELVQGWGTLLAKYNLHDNVWMKETWEIKEKWAHVHLKWSFTCGMRSTQLSKSLNAKIKRCVKFDHDITHFFIHIDRLVTEERENVLVSIYHSRENLPRLRWKKCPVLIQVATLYTPPLLDLFQDEVDTSLCCQVKQHSEFEGKFKSVISVHGMDNEFFVWGNVELDEFGNNICRDVCCNCRKFESFGILCGHAIKGLDRMSVMAIPQGYILHRWSLDAKDYASKGNKYSVVENNLKLVKAARFRSLCPKLVQLAARSCESQVAYDFVDKTVDYLCAEVDKMFRQVGDSTHVEGD